MRTPFRRACIGSVGVCFRCRVSLDIRIAEHFRFGNKAHIFNVYRVRAVVALLVFVVENRELVRARFGRNERVARFPLGIDERARHPRHGVLYHPVDLYEYFVVRCFRLEHIIKREHLSFFRAEGGAKNGIGIALLRVRRMETLFGGRAAVAVVHFYVANHPRPRILVVRVVIVVERIARFLVIDQVFDVFAVGHRRVGELAVRFRFAVVPAFVFVDANRSRIIFANKIIENFRKEFYVDFRAYVNFTKYAVSIDDKGYGNGAVQAQDFSVKVVCVRAHFKIFNLALLFIRGNRSNRIAGIGAQTYHFHVVHILSLRHVHDREFRRARSAPSRPEIDEHHFLGFERFVERERRAVGKGRFKVVHNAAVRVFRALGHRFARQKSRGERERHRRAQIVRQFIFSVRVITVGDIVERYVIGRGVEIEHYESVFVGIRALNHRFAVVRNHFDRDVLHGDFAVVEYVEGVGDLFARRRRLGELNRRCRAKYVRRRRFRRVVCGRSDRHGVYRGEKAERNLAVFVRRARCRRRFAKRQRHGNVFRARVVVVANGDFVNDFFNRGRR